MEKPDIVYNHIEAAELSGPTNQAVAHHLPPRSIDEIQAALSLFINQYDLSDHAETLNRGAVIAHFPDTFHEYIEISEEEKEILKREAEHKWHQPKALYRMIIFCSIAAAVNGMDLVSINGANIFFPKQFGIDRPGKDQWILGLVNSAPYLCCAFCSVWLNGPLNRWIGRRGVLFVTGFVCFAACIWAACTNTWWHLMIARAFLGFGIGPKSATLSVYAAEASPASIRGALTMCWQIWVAFGIMLGTVFNIAFYNIPDRSGIVGLNWRLMLGVAGIPALIVMAQAYTNPESPRWLMLKGRYREALQSLKTLRNSDIQALRDLYYIHVLLKEEEKVQEGQTGMKFFRIFTLRRNRNALIGATIVMFAQQFCGVNIISYYSTTIFAQAGGSTTHALLASWGFGMLNVIFALPAIKTIDTFGRRSLLLYTFPFMALFLVLTACGFYITNSTGKLVVVALGIYFYVIAYSPGEGPVPFVYSAEAFPLAYRDIGMSCAVFVCWFFNAIVGLTFPSILDTFGPPGTFFWYAGWNCLLYITIYLFLPETKSLSLEELDVVFELPMKTRATNNLKDISNNIKRIFGKLGFK
ncbi:MFS sugar transporter [Xylogone sp. PMI_703]|nr:MFS sugar transporter [Xylogone sp. PMI_703]